MRIEDEMKLDFSDVLIRPKRSTLVSRKEAVLTRTFKFKWTNERWTGVPIIASNICLLYTSPSPRDATLSRMPSSA